MATFGLKYYAELRSKYMNIIWRVEIAERGYSGSADHIGSVVKFRTPMF